ncbi:hypothetical protein, partial [Caulobacter sp. S45]|uniref:hypothetical protein n=1 Tax=Caulobacter sp. S45 TaxID=1641861 RepID=UPI001C2DE046
GRVGLRIMPRPDERHWALTPMIAALGVALACAGLDRAFRPALDPAYLNAMVRQPWQARTAVYMAHAFNEEVMYRLFLGSLLANVLILFSKARRDISDGALLWAAFVLAQGVNVAINLWSVSPAPVSVLPYQMLRYFAPGMVWAGLYIRRGFMAAETGHLTTHLIFQPLVGVLLSH